MSQVKHCPWAVVSSYNGQPVLLASTLEYVITPVTGA